MLKPAERSVLVEFAAMNKDLQQQPFVFEHEGYEAKVELFWWQGGSKGPD
ncbi:hypothetical protein [Pseudomonas xanthosomatis]